MASRKNKIKAGSRARQSAPTDAARPSAQASALSVIDPQAAANLVANRTMLVYLLAAMLIAATFVVYMPCWHGDWLWDDNSLLLNNPILQTGGFAKVWTPPGYLGYWPLTYTAYWFEYQFWGLDPFGFHLGNIALHVVAARLVWRLLTVLRLPGAFFAAAIFALHPVAVETVAWIAQLRGVLSVVLALASLLLFLGYERDKRRWRYALSLVAFLLSALAKGDALTMPIVLLALAWWQRGRIDRRDILRVIPYVAIAAAMAGLEIWSQRVSGSASVRTDGFFSRFAIAGCAVWFYLRSLIWPATLIPIYPRWTVGSSDLISYLPSLALIALLAVAWWRPTTWGRPVVMFLVCYVALLLPVLGFVNITYMRYSLVADHWQYLAMIVPCAAAAAACVTAAGRWWRRPATQFGCAAVLLLLAALTVRQSEMYFDQEIYYTETLARNPDCWFAEVSLGFLLNARNDPAGIKHFYAALRLNPDVPEPHACLAAALIDRGQFDAAMPQLSKALDIQPDYPGANANLAVIFANRGQFDLAIEHLQTEHRLHPEAEFVGRQLAEAVAERDQIQSTVNDLEQQIRKRPTDSKLLIRTAWLLATNPNASIRNGRKAVELAERATKLTGADAHSLLTLAAAYAETGRFSDAIATAERAIQRSDNKDFAEECRKQLAIYKAAKPSRQLVPDPKSE